MIASKQQAMPPLLSCQQGKLTIVKAFFLVFFLALAGGTYWAAGYINQQQEKVSEWVSEQLGYPVEIGQATISWRQLSPQLALNAVKVLGEDNAPPLLTLQALYLDVDFYDSVRFAELRIDNITIAGLKLGVVRDEFGLLALQGLNQQGDSTPLFAELLVRSNNLDSFNLDAIIVDYIDKGQPLLSGRYHVNHAVVKHQSRQWQAEGVIALPSKMGQQVQFEVGWLLNMAQPELTTWQWVANIDGILIERFKQYLSWQDLMLKQGRVDVSLTGKGRGNEMHTADVLFDLEHGLLIDQQQRSPAVIVEHLSGDAHWIRRDDGWQLGVKQFQCQLDGNTWPTGQLNIEQAQQTTRIAGSFLHLDNILSVAQLTGVLPEAIVGRQPQGELSQYQFSYDTEQGLQQAIFTLTSGAISQWQAYPGVDNVDLMVHMEKDKAEVELHSQNVTLYPGDALAEPLFFDAITGQIAIDRGEEDQWTVTSRDVTVTNPDLTVKVNGLTTLDANQAIHNDLVINVADVAMARWKNYVPQAPLHIDFKRWSKEAFQAGKITQGEIVLKGDLAAFPYQSEQDKQRGSFDMTMQVEDVHLHYAEDWPDLFDITGTVTGKGHNLIIQSQQANIAGYNVKTIRVDIDHLLEPKPVLTAKGQLLGATQQALNFLQNSPLEQRFGAVATGMAAKGQSELNLSLLVPLTDSKNTDVSGNIRFINNALYPKAMSQSALQQVNGQLQFNNQGVSGQGLQAIWLDQPVSVDVIPKANKTVIAAKTRTSLAALRQQWPMIPRFFDGVLDYELDVSVSERQLGDFYVDIALKSDLQGVAIDLPAPFGKTTQQTRPSQLVFNQSQVTPFYQLNYGQQQVLLRPSRTDLLSVQQVEMSLSDLDMAMWQQWMGQQAETATSAPALQSVNVSIGQLTGFGQDWANMSIKANAQDKQWQIAVASADVSGQISLPYDRQSGVLRARLERLTLATSTDSSSEIKQQDSLWPAMDILIDQLTIDDLLLGQATLRAHTQGERWIIDEGQLRSPAYQATVTGEWWKTQQHNESSIQFSASSQNMDSLLTQLNYPPVMEAADANLTAALTWPGSPIDFAKQNAKGKMQFALKKGKLNQVEPGAAGRMFGLISITAIPRRLSLDFNELFGKGLNFSLLEGKFDIAQGLADIDALSLRGGAANIDMTGSIDLVDERYDQIVKITPNVSSTLPFAGAVAGGPIGLGVGTAIFLADKIAGKLFDKEIVNVVSYTYRLTGSWQNPELNVVGPTLAQ